MRWFRRRRITKEAEALLKQVDAGGIPFALTNNLIRIGKENGITALTAKGVVDGLRAKVKR